MEVNELTDKLGRSVRDLRISVTDRCNFRCTYCMPKSVFNAKYSYIRRDQLLSFEEIERVARACVDQGVTKIRLTGGEPLVRAKLERLIACLAKLPGVSDLSMTTNGSLLSKDKARMLRDIGLNRLNISLDALDDATFKRINDVTFPAQRVLDAIECAAEVGFAPIKINMVVQRNLNKHSILPMARYFHASGHIVRFIEYMDVGNSNGWRRDEVISASDIAQMINEELPIEPVDPNYSSEVAKRWRYLDGGGEIGIISSVTQPFCSTCSRVRLSAQGKLYTCLFASQGHDLRALLRCGVSDEDLKSEIRLIWGQRSDRYSEIRSANMRTSPKIEMSYIGG